LNKQYSEEEYVEKIKAIKEDMKHVEWFPSTYDEVITYGL